MPSPPPSPRGRRRTPTARQRATPPPIAIPDSRAAAAKRAEAIAVWARRQQALAVATSALLVVLVALELVGETEELAREWSFWVVTLVFPSRQITWIKIACVLVSIVLSTSYFVSSQSQLATAERMVRDSASALISPFSPERRRRLAADHGAKQTPTGTTTAGWLASHCQSLLRTDHFADGPDDRVTTEIPQLRLRDECLTADTPVPLSDSSRFESVNGKSPIPINSDYFQGHCLVLVRHPEHAPERRTNWSDLFVAKRRRLWVQVQGRFKRPPPPRSVLYLATELPAADGFNVAFLTRQLVTLLIALVKKFVPTSHISFGDKCPDDRDSELPHAAFPLYQTVDEFVVTGQDDDISRHVPTLGSESFGETSEQKAKRSNTPVGEEPHINLGVIYTFQFHTMYADLAQWKIVNVPGMPDIDLRRFCGTQPIQLAAYMIGAPAMHPAVLSSLPHKKREKDYVFCFSIHHADERSADIPPNESPNCNRTGSDGYSSDAPSMPSPPTSPSRWRSVSCDPPAVLTRSPQQSPRGDAPGRPQPRIRASSSVRSMTSLERAGDLANWKFHLPLWIERVDPAAGIRKVAYLIVIENCDPHNVGPTNPRRRYVVRSASTVKTALLLMESDNDLPKSDVAIQQEFKKLIVEAREFQYETICEETERVSRFLKSIAMKSSIEATPLDTDRKAMLYNCLMSEAYLPRIRTFQDIGVQLTRSKRDQLDIIFESGVYRMLDRRFMRQEWFILTTSTLQFYRSFAVKSSKSVALSDILRICAVDDAPFLNTPDEREPSSVSSDRRSAGRWWCVQVRTIVEVVTIFFDNDGSRAQCIATVSQLLKLKNHALLSNISIVDPLEGLSTAKQLNFRNPLGPREFSSIFSGASSVRSTLSTTTFGNEIVAEVAHRGIPLGVKGRREISIEEVVRFLDGVDYMSEVCLHCGQRHNHESPELHVRRQDYSACMSSAAPWLQSRDQVIAFSLNIFQILFIHARVLHGDATNTALLKKLKTLPFYLLGPIDYAERLVQLTLSDIEYGLLQGHPAPTDETSVFYSAGKTATSQNGQGPLAARDFRTSLVLPTNCTPSLSYRLLRCYSTSSSMLFEEQLNEACALFLDHNCVIDDLNRIILLPKICEWNINDYGSATAGMIGSQAFFCLQKLLSLMSVDQHNRVQHLLLGADKECQIKFGRFWTQDGGLTKSSSPAREDQIPAVDTNTSTIRRTGSALQYLQTLFKQQ